MKEIATAQYVLTLNRVFDAPVANIWRCWVQPELFAQYFNAETKKEHEKKGLYTNWNKASDQLEALAKSLTDSDSNSG